MIQSQIRNEIQQCLLPGAGPPPFRVELARDALSLTVTLADVQPLACALWQLEVHHEGWNTLQAEQLTDVANRLTQRVRYLLEPLQVHEIDDAQAAVQVRSSPPQRDPQSKAVCYYEALLGRDGGLTLVRFEKLPGQSRTQIPAVVTVEVLERLCEDLYAIVTEPL